MRSTKPIGPALARAPRPSAGGCDFAEDPQFDARQVRPLWVPAPAPSIRVHADHDNDDCFCIWRVAGRKQLTLRGRALVFEAMHRAHRVRAQIDADVADGLGFSLSVALDEGVRSRLASCEEQAAVLRGERLLARLREITRAGLLHLRALQALDGQQGGASHREIAEVLFGEDAVHVRWSADGELRAQVRHLLARAQEFLQGGYLKLAASP